MAKIKEFVKEKSGVSAIEYGLIASLVAIALIVGSTLFGPELNKLFGFVP